MLECLSPEQKAKGVIAASVRTSPRASPMGYTRHRLRCLRLGQDV